MRRVRAVGARQPGYCVHAHSAVQRGYRERSCDRRGWSISRDPWGRARKHAFMARTACPWPGRRSVRWRGACFHAKYSLLSRSRSLAGALSLSPLVRCAVRGVSASTAARGGHHCSSGACRSSPHGSAAFSGNSSGSAPARRAHHCRFITIVSARTREGAPRAAAARGAARTHTKS